jgi:hypothetical protein
MKNQKKYGLRFLLVIGSIVTLLMASSINACAEDKEGQVRWDLTDLFASDAAWEQAFTEIQTKIKALADDQKGFGKSAANIATEYLFMPFYLTTKTNATRRPKSAEQR